MVVVLHHRSHRVLEDLEEHVVQVRGHIHGPDGQALRGLAAVLRNLQRRTGQVVLVAQEAGILVRVFHHIRQITGGVQTSDVATTRMGITSKKQGYK